METRQNIRKLHRMLRDEMQRGEVEQKSRQICMSLLTSDWYHETQLIYAFYPLGNEVSLVTFFEQALLDGKQIALPKVQKEDMEFYLVSSLMQLEEGCFHVMEPIASCKQSRLTEKDEPVVLVPGLVFDESGNRYGYGKGYYDRYFSRYPQIKKRYGICYEHQVETQIRVSVQDVPMSRIYTEEKVRYMK